MLSIFNGLRDIYFGSVVFRMLLAFACGGVIGLERSAKNRPAGIRTHILICIGAAVASVTGIYLYVNQHQPADISRIGAQVVSGLGFIGGGTIIVTRKQTIKGLTTAAGLWASGVIGLALGAGYYEGGIVATLLVLFTEIFFFRVSARIKHNPEFSVRLRYHSKSALDQVLRYCKNRRISISNLRITGSSEEYTAEIALRPRLPVEEDELVGRVRDMEGVLSAELML